MTKAILYQKQIMQQALKVLNEIETVKALFAGIDNDHVAEETKRLQSEYAELMAMLTKHVCKATGFQIILAPVQNNVVSIAEQKFSEVV